MMTREQMESEATSMTEQGLRDSLDWNIGLAEHYDENMDLSGYNLAQEKIEIIKAELSRRNRR